MFIRRRPAWGLVALLAGFASSVLSPPPAKAAPNWADQNYRNRRKVTVSNYANAPVSLNDVVTFTFTPNFGAFDGKTKVDGTDVHIFYQPDDTTVKDVPQVLLPMGSGSTKILFSAAAALPAGAPFPFARSTAGSSTFTAGGDSLLLRDDDKTTIATLPFDFPYQGTNHRQVLVSTNGWLSFNLSVVDGHYAGFDAKYFEQANDFIAPFGTDLVTYSTDGDVWEDTSVADQVTFRWKAAKFVSGTIPDSTCNFSATLYKNGDIRFKYGNPCTINENVEPTRQVDVGIAVGSIAVDLLDQYPVEKYPRPSGTPAALDFSNHPDIVFTAQAANVPADANYYVYYNNPLDDGKGTRALPDPSKLKFYTFDDPGGSTEGWVAANSDVGSVFTDVPSGSLLMQSPQLGDTGGHPAAVAAGMDDVSDQTVYARMRANGANQHEVGIMARANTSGAGYMLNTNGWKDLNAHTSNSTPGVFSGLGVRTEVLRSHDPGPSFNPDYSTPDATVIGVYDQAGRRYRPGTAFSYAVMELKGIGAATRLHGKVFSDGSGEPAGYLYEFVGDATNDVPHYNTGKLGLSGYGGAGATADTQQLDWVYDVLNPNAERMSYGVDAEEEQPVPPGKGTLKGTVSDAQTSAIVGYVVPLSGANIHIHGAGSGFDIVVVSNSAGQYNVYAPPDVYTISCGASGYTTSISNGNSLVAGGTTVVDFPLTPPNLLTNADFETVDPAAPGVKPKGWYRKNYEFANPPNTLVMTEPNPTAITRPMWLYATTGSDTSSGGKTVNAMANGGTHFIGIDGSLPYDGTDGYNVGNICSWQPESSTPNPVYTDTGDPSLTDHIPYTNPDGRGQGPLARITPGAYYLVTGWINHPYGTFVSTGFNRTYSPLARLRLRPLAFDNESDNVGGGQNFIGNGFTITVPSQTDQSVNNGWVQVGGIIQAPGGANYLSVRCYGVDIPPGQPVYFDNLSVTRVTPPLFAGTVKDSSGNPVPLSYVGIAEANRGTQPGAGMANPIVGGYTFTDANGRWGTRFLPTSGVSYVAQSYLDLFVDDHGNKASGVYPVPTPPAQTAITYDPVVEANIALNKAVVSYSSQTATDPLTSDAGPAFHVTDGTVYWWNSDANDANPGGGPTNPQWVVIDLGQSIEWDKVDQVTIENRQPADHYQLRVSDTPPPASAPYADKAAYTAAANVAKTWGTLVYNSPTSAGLRWANGYLNCISKPALQTSGVTGRYLMYIADTVLAPYTEYKIYEIRVEVPTATLVGRVVDGSGHGVAKAAVGVNPDGPLSLYSTTDNAGNYTLNNVPVGVPISITAHLISSGSTVYALSNAATVSPVQGKITPVRDISLGNPVPNAVGAGATASIDNPLLENANSSIVPGLTVDQNFSTLWESSVISQVPGPGLPVVDVDHPLGLIVDMGSAKFINTVVITWTKELAPFYSVDLSSDGVSFLTKYTTVSATGGYPYNLNGQVLDGVDVVTFSPTSARYIRVSMTAHAQDRLGIREIQAALAVPPGLPPERLTGLRALRIAGGLEMAPLQTDADFAVLDANGDKSINLKDATILWKKSNGLN